jgi:hypothetical protein
MEVKTKFLLTKLNLKLKTDGVARCRLQRFREAGGGGWGELGEATRPAVACLSPGGGSR